MQAECRVRMLNFISRAPIDCPVAVVFGHSSLMNWAGPAYDKSGIDVASAIWKAGFPVDMIPSSEIADGSLTIGPDGSVQYGPQSYRAVVLVHPEFETHHTAQFFSRVNPEQTMLTRLGVWTRNFDAEPLDGPALLPAEMAELPDANAAAKRVVEYLAKTGVPRQAALASSAAWGGYSQQLPGMAGCCSLIDGTWIRIAARRACRAIRSGMRRVRRALRGSRRGWARCRAFRRRWPAGCVCRRASQDTTGRRPLDRPPGAGRRGAVA